MSIGNIKYAQPHPQWEARTDFFQFLVLQALWILLLAAVGRNPIRLAVSWRVGVLDFADKYGVQGDEAKKFRRETVYPEIIE